MCSIDLEPCEVWREEHRRAKKEHRCSCCGTVIRIGERYLSNFAVFEGTASSERCCLFCEEARNEFGHAHDVIPAPSTLVDLLEECLDDRDEESVTRWRPMLDAIRARKAA